MKNSNAMVTIYVRWAGRSFEHGYEIWIPPTRVWHPIPVEGVRNFLKNGGIVHMNPEYIPEKIEL